jgi:hypothetical protein
MLTSFNKSNLADVRSAINTSLNDVADHFGITLEVGNISFEGSNFTAKLKANIVSEDGVVQTRERKDFTRYAKTLCDLDPDWLDKSYTNSGNTYKITGLKTKATKNKIMLECSDGRGYVAPAEMVKLMMEREI